MGWSRSVLHTRLNLQSRNRVKTQGSVIKDYAQNSKQFVYPTLRLSISSNPSRADVFIDGQRVGTTPFDQSQLPLGRHEVKVSKRFSLDYGDYQPSETKTVEVSPGDQSVWFDLLTPPSLRVTSSPSGATVMVNEQRMGTTPSTLNLPPGEHAIQLSGGPAYTQPMEAVSLPPNGETDLSFDLRLRPGYRIKRRMGMLWRFRNAHREATKAIADYDTLVGTYREAFTPDEFDEPRFDEAKVLYNQVKKAQSTERSFAIRVAVVWGVNLAHTYLTRLKSPSIVQQVTPTPRFEVAAKPNPQSPNIRLAMRF